MRIHCISHGGRVTSSLAVQLQKLGHTVTGSDDEIYEPSKGLLTQHGLLPDTQGWRPDMITSDIDLIVLGMHATADNPELIKAQKLGLIIQSYPEVIYEFAKNKTRVVIAGSHGKTTTTSMVMHVLRHNNIPFDRVVGGIVPGFDSMVSLTDDTKIIVIEGDEYPDGKINMKAKMLLYNHNIGILNGIARDHITTYPTFDSYVAPFVQFVNQTPTQGFIGYYDQDAEVMKVINNTTTLATTQSYHEHPNLVRDSVTYLITPQSNEVRLEIFGVHNCINISAALTICKQLHLHDDQFYDAIGSFNGAGNRLELVHQDDNRNLTVLRDFAHSPSKLKATVKAVVSQYPDRTIIALFELHTFASLSASFMSEYAHHFDQADVACVYYDAHSFEVKHMTPLTKDIVKDGFCREDLVILDSAQDLSHWYGGLNLQDSVVLLMSSGNFGDVEFV